jgi:hypothetical protein
MLRFAAQPEGRSLPKLPRRIPIWTAAWRTTPGVTMRLPTAHAHWALAVTGRADPVVGALKKALEARLIPRR